MSLLSFSLSFKFPFFSLFGDGEKKNLVSKILLKIPFIDSQSKFRSQYNFKPIWGAYRRRSNFASNSKPQS